MMAGTLTTAAEDCATLARNGNVVVNNCYYMTAYGKVQGNSTAMMTNEELLENLPGWVIDRNNQVVPNLGNDISTTVANEGLLGSGTASDPYLITSDADWETFADWVISKNSTHANKHYRLTTDITVTKMAGKEEDYCDFKGTFDGNGHTMRLNIVSDGTDYVAPFRRLYNGTIKNLRIIGTVDAGEQKYASSLIGRLLATSTIENCWSSVTIKGDRSRLADKEASHGAFIAVLRGANNTVTINNCRFDGSITDPSATSCGGFVGYHNTHRLNLTNCVMEGQLNVDLTDCATFVRTTTSNTITFNNCSYLKAYGTVQGTASTSAGSFWYAWDNRAKMTLRVKAFNRAGQLVETTDYDITATEVQEKLKEVQLHRSCVQAEIELLVNSGSSPLRTTYSNAATDTAHYVIQDMPADKFRFESSGKVEKTVLAETRQSSVVLTWDTDGNVIDFFEVMRKRAGEDDSHYG